MASDDILFIFLSIIQKIPCFSIVLIYQRQSFYCLQSGFIKMLVILSLLCTAASNVSLNDFQSKGLPLKVFKVIFSNFTPSFLLKSLRISIGFVISGWYSRNLCNFRFAFFRLILNSVFFFQIFHEFIVIYIKFCILSLSSVASFSVSSSVSNKDLQSIFEFSFLSLPTN